MKTKGVASLKFLWHDYDQVTGRFFDLPHLPRSVMLRRELGGSYGKASPNPFFGHECPLCKNEAWLEHTGEDVSAGLTSTFESLFCDVKIWKEESLVLGVPGPKPPFLDIGFFPLNVNRDKAAAEEQYSKARSHYTSNNKVSRHNLPDLFAERDALREEVDRIARELKEIFQKVDNILKVLVEEANRKDEQASNTSWFGIKGVRSDFIDGKDFLWKLNPAKMKLGDVTEYWWVSE